MRRQARHGVSGKGVGALRHRELTNQEISTILRLGRQGVFYWKIAEEIGRGKSTVHQVLAKNGVHRATAREPMPHNRGPRRNLALPVAPDGFIRAPTKAQLMARR